MSAPRRILFHSSRGGAAARGFSEALLEGLASDGGLYVPGHWPALTAAAFAAGEELPAVAERLLAPFLEGDALGAQLPALVREAFNFPAPLVPLTEDARLSVLELFHGPTAAFKDFGARFLAGAFSRLRPGAGRPLTILVATSGDTGGAVAAAFHGRAGIKWWCSFPGAGSRRRRNGSSPAGAATCARSRCAARSMTVSAW